MKIPVFANKSELFKFLKENKNELIAEKKYSVKHGDCINYQVSAVEDCEETTKAISNPTDFSGSEIKVSSVINTTNIMDSHSDVHIKGIWSKSVKENKNIYLLEEHKMSFRNIISDKVKATLENKSWNELGFNQKGETQALVFHSTIYKDRNPYMFEQYLKGYVKNHSVGMQYVKMDLAVNSTEKYYAEEKATWDKYINDVVNKTDAEAQGYFWAVTEAKIIEGSAVPLGSNRITPTLSVEEKDIEADNIITSTHEPLISTQPKQQIDYNYLITNLKH